MDHSKHRMHDLAGVAGLIDDPRHPHSHMQIVLRRVIAVEVVAVLAVFAALWVLVQSVG